MTHESGEVATLGKLTLFCVSQDSSNWALFCLLLLKYIFDRGIKNDTPALGSFQMLATSPVPQPTHSY